MTTFRFGLAVGLACHVGFSRLHRLRFLTREPMLTGILQVLKLPPQSTFWRFLAGNAPGIADDCWRCNAARGNESGKPPECS